MRHNQRFFAYILKFSIYVSILLPFIHVYIDAALLYSSTNNLVDPLLVDTYPLQEDDNITLIAHRPSNRDSEFDISAVIDNTAIDPATVVLNLSWDNKGCTDSTGQLNLSMICTSVESDNTKSQCIPDITSIEIDQYTQVIPTTSILPSWGAIMNIYAPCIMSRLVLIVNSSTESSSQIVYGDNNAPQSVILPACPFIRQLQWDYGLYSPSMKYYDDNKHKQPSNIIQRVDTIASHLSFKMILYTPIQTQDIIINMYNNNNNNHISRCILPLSSVWRDTTPNSLASIVSIMGRQLRNYCTVSMAVIYDDMWPFSIKDPVYITMELSFSSEDDNDMYDSINTPQKSLNSIQFVNNKPYIKSLHIEVENSTCNLPRRQIFSTERVVPPSDHNVYYFIIETEYAGMHSIALSYRFSLSDKDNDDTVLQSEAYIPVFQLESVYDSKLDKNIIVHKMDAQSPYGIPDGLYFSEISTKPYISLSFSINNIVNNDRSISTCDKIYSESINYIVTEAISHTSFQIEQNPLEPQQGYIHLYVVGKLHQSYNIQFNYHITYQEIENGDIKSIIIKPLFSTTVTAVNKYQSFIVIVEIERLYEQIKQEINSNNDIFRILSFQSEAIPYRSDGITRTNDMTRYTPKYKHTALCIAPFTATCNYNLNLICKTEGSADDYKWIYDDNSAKYIPQCTCYDDWYGNSCNMRSICQNIYNTMDKCNNRGYIESIPDNANNIIKYINRSTSTSLQSPLLSSSSSSQYKLASLMNDSIPLQQLDNDGIILYSCNEQCTCDDPTQWTGVSCAQRVSCRSSTLQCGSYGYVDTSKQDNNKDDDDNETCNDTCTCLFGYTGPLCNQCNTIKCYRGEYNPQSLCLDDPNSPEIHIIDNKRLPCLCQYNSLGRYCQYYSQNTSITVNNLALPSWLINSIESLKKKSLNDNSNLLMMRQLQNGDNDDDDDNSPLPETFLSLLSTLVDSINTILDYDDDNMLTNSIDKNLTKLYQQDIIERTIIPLSNISIDSMKCIDVNNHNNIVYIPSSLSFTVSIRIGESTSSVSAELNTLYSKLNNITLHSNILTTTIKDVLYQHNIKNINIDDLGKQCVLNTDDIVYEIEEPVILDDEDDDDDGSNSSSSSSNHIIQSFYCIIISTLSFVLFSFILF